MCLGVPGKIIEIYEKDGLRMGKIDFGGASAKPAWSTCPRPQVGEYVIVHVGFAISR